MRKMCKVMALSLATVSLLTSSTFANETVVDSNDAVSIYQNTEDKLRGSSSPKFFSVGNRNFKNSTASWLSSGKAYGTTYIDRVGGVEPSGWLGAHCNLYNQATGKVVSTGDWDFSTKTSSSFSRSTPKVSLKGKYFTRGTTKVYNGNGYTTKGANESPIVIIKSAGIKISDEELQERQYLYETKGLIAAEGQNEVEGYVSEADLYDEENQPTTPEEAIAYSLKRQKQGPRYIPLYDNDGTTIIGTYKVG